MSDTESLDYLQTGFNPASLTVPRLRSILVSHNIAYPASAKKPQLIELFEENVLPQSRKILSARARARRTSKGITNADQDDDDTANGEVMPPPPTPRARNSSRKVSTRVKVEDSESEVAPARSPTKRTPRASSARRSKASESEATTEPEPAPKSVRKSRKSDAPAIKAEEVETPRKPAEDGVFSYDNPFQSGSSPPSGARTSSGESRRKSEGVKEPSRRKSSSNTRRRTDGIIKSEYSPTSRTFEIPVSRLNGSADVDDGVEAGEDFTPEEQLELVRDRSSRGLSAVGPRRTKKKSKGIGKTPFAAVLLALLGGYGAWYGREKTQVGYCGVGREAHPIIPDNVDLPDWAVQLVEPQCEPCPQHAYCYQNFETKCEPDFVLKHHPLSLGGVLPIPPTCEPDGEKVRKIQAVANRAIEELRERRAEWECGSLTDSVGAPVPTVEIDASDLKAQVSLKRRKGMGEAEFEELWAGAIGEIKAREEVESNTDGTGKIFLTSTSLARISLSCSIRRSLRLAVAAYRLQIALLVVLVGSVFYIRSQFHDWRASNQKIPELVDLTLEKLTIQAGRNAIDKEAFPEAFISVGQLRDDVLRSEHSVKKREALWQKVKKIVERNANVRASQRESRSGEIARVWEWIGAVTNTESILEGMERRKSGRVSWGQYGDRSSPVSGTDEGPEMVMAKWKEGRPVY